MLGPLRIYRTFVLPTAILAGTIIGAGIFALPFVFHTSGVGIGILYLVAAGGIYTLIHLLYADILLRMPGTHRFVGLATRFTGRGGGALAIVVSVIQMLFVMTIYLVLSQSFSALLFPGMNRIVPLIVFWILGSAALFSNARRIAILEFLSLLGIIGVILFVFAIGLPELHAVRWIDIAPRASLILLPLAPVLFSLAGRVAIPSLISLLRAEHVPQVPRALRRAIIAGTVIPAVVYLLFVLGVFGLTPNPTEDAVTGLASVLSGPVLLALGALGLVALWSSYITVGLDVHSILRYDLSAPRALRAALVIGGPPLLFAAGFQQFIPLIAFVGGIFLSLEGMLILLMWQQANRTLEAPPSLIRNTPSFGIAAAWTMFAAALLYELITYFS